MRHTFRNVCTEANFGARIRYSDNVSGPLPTSNVVLPNCVHRPVHQAPRGLGTYIVTVGKLEFSERPVGFEESP